MIIGVIGAKGKLGQAIVHEARGNVIEVARKNRDVSACDVLVDASNAESLLENILLNKPLVIGTTGHKTLDPIKEASKHLPIFFAPNFSLWMTLMKKIAAFLKANFASDIDLIEMHHKEKKDAPSGSAKMLAEVLGDVKIHSLRTGKNMGEHTLIFNNDEEQITLTHKVHSRTCFANGALMAAR